MAERDPAQETAGPDGALSEAKRRLLAARLQGAQPPDATRQIAARAPGEALMATPLQAAMYVLAGLAAEPAAYNIHIAISLEGRLDADLLARAVEALAERHESLRTSFEQADAGLRLRIAQDRTGDLLRADYADRRDPTAAIEAAAVELARRPFELSAPPLWRSALLRAAPDRHVLVLVVHHSVCDERSLSLLLDELLEYYGLLLEGRELPPRPERDYPDFALWLRDELSASRAIHLDYWRKRLDGVDTASALPTDFPRPRRSSGRGALAERTVGPAVARAIGALARDRGASDYMVLLAAFQYLLGRYTGSDNLVVGAPVSLRGPRPSDRMVGLFINPLPLRATIDRRHDFNAHLAATREHLLADLAHRELPFDELVADMAPQRDAGRNPVFQVMFVLETEPDPAGRPGLGATLQRYDTGTAKLDLTVFARLGSEGLRLTAEYSTDLFERTTIETLLAAYESVMRSVTAAPTRSLASLSLIDEHERAAWLDDARGPALDLGGSPSVARRIAAAAEAGPDREAVVQSGQRWEYAMLRARSENLAARLHDGTDPICVLLPRGPDAVGAIVAALAAGVPYVPLDPSAPDPRLAHIVAELRDAHDGRSPRIVCAAGDRARVERIGGIPRSLDVSVDPAAPAPAIADADAADLAYVIYTSGSTGAPKGVAITHGGLTASNLARDEFYGPPPQRFLLVSPLHFDSSVAGLYWTLCGGGTLVLPQPDLAADPRHLATCIAEEQVTDTLLLPSLHRLLLEAASPGQLDSLRRVIVAGEALDAELVATHERLLPQAALFNEYGPTEATVWATATRCSSRDARPSIGRPIANGRAYVLDRDGNPLPRGAVGELYLGGPGIARDYVGQPDLSAERFLSDPFERGARCYRSGDLVRRRGNGDLEFLGRADDQLKIRGHRVEPAEIEAALLALDGIDEAAVLGRAATGGTRLEAWCRSAADNLTPAAVRRALTASLPAYLVPAVVHLVPSLPRTGTGKIDRRALATAAPPTTESGADAPALSRLEQRLARLWRRLLDVEQIDRDSDFFELGGHSLVGVTLMLEIEREFSCAMPLSVLFESPTLGGLAERIAGTDDRGRPLHYLNPVQIGSEPPVFVMVQGQVHELARLVGPRQPVYLAYRSIDSENFQRQSVRDHAAATLAEIRRLQPSGPYCFGGYSFGGQVALEMARLLQEDGETMGLLALIDPPPTETNSYAQIQAARLAGRIRSAGSPLARLGYVLKHGPRYLSRLLRRRWQRLRIRRLEGAGQPLPHQLVIERDRVNYIKTSAGYAYERYDGDLLLIVPEGHDGLGQRTVEAWEKLVGGRLDARLLAGARTHADLLESPWREEIAQHLRDALAAAKDGAATDRPNTNGDTPAVVGVDDTLAGSVPAPADR